MVAKSQITEVDDIANNDKKLEEKASDLVRISADNV